VAQKYIPVALRRLVRERAEERCEYCSIPESMCPSTHWIDHVYAEKHGGQTVGENLALACIVCNQHKGSDLTSIDPESGLITPLFNPRIDSWADHFRAIDGTIEPLTPQGRVTVRLLQFNLPYRVEERKVLQRLGLL
jgi:5-methylcytosine-specific restriction endonuclease McrA